MFRGPERGWGNANSLSMPWARVGLGLLEPVAGLVGLAALRLLLSKVETLHKCASINGPIDATLLTALRWDRVCAVGPYRDGRGGDGLRKPFDNSCLTARQRPVLLTSGPDTLILGHATP